MIVKKLCAAVLPVILTGVMIAAEQPTSAKNPKNESKKMVKAGFYECDITPPYGADCPGDFRKRRILKFSDPLKVRVMALSDGELKQKIDEISAMFEKAKSAIGTYERESR